MFRRLLTASLLLLAALPGWGQAGDTGGKRLVDFRADIMRPVKVAPDSSVLNLIGHVVFYHNGAVIQCDSAVRYSDKKIECFRNVVINQNTTYVYGDRVDYNGEINTATVYAPLIKLIDEEAILHTYHLAFDTKTKIATYTGGGTMTNKENVMESQRGYYNTETRDITLVEKVEIENPDYKLKSDSVTYNMTTEQARFFVKSYIWNAQGEILSAESGLYRKEAEEYEFWSDSYAVSELKEIWADTLIYGSKSENATAIKNVQIRDEEQHTMGFGDYGQYWGADDRVMLTLDPSMFSFEPGEDTLYMRSDTMYMYTVSREEFLRRDSVSVKEEVQEEELISSGPGAPAPGGAGGAKKPEGTQGMPAQQTADGTVTETGQAAESTGTDQQQPGEQPEGQVEEEPSDGEPSAEPPPDEGATEQALLPADKKVARAAEKAAREKERLARITEIEAEKAAKKAEKEEAEAQRKAEKAAEREQKLAAEAHDHDHDHEGHSHEGETPDSLAALAGDSLAMDSLASGGAAARLRQAGPAAGPGAGLGAGKGLQADSLAVDSLATDSIPAEQQDSLVRIMQGYRNVRIFRTDFQAVCDSIVSFSIDSTIHLYIDPVMWNEQNQIKSDVIDVYTKNQKIHKAVFTGSPFMCSEVDSLHYNQIKGKVMEAFFEENKIKRLDVNGNGETYYFMQEEGDPEITGFLPVESGDISFYMEDNKIVTITWRVNPVYFIYPMDKIPVDQQEFLPGFVWLIERKPALEDVFNRVERPSRREEYQAMPGCEFPTTESIMTHREKMIKEGVWRDRNDTVSELAREFIRTLGY